MFLELLEADILVMISSKFRHENIIVFSHDSQMYTSGSNLPSLIQTLYIELLHLPPHLAIAKD
jgi:hypothetical protein